MKLRPPSSNVPSQVYAFDDDIIMTGANLSEDYFTKRQDRYITIQVPSKWQEYYLALARASYHTWHCCAPWFWLSTSLCSTVVPVCASPYFF
jgi:hypothetical protein